VIDLDSIKRLGYLRRRMAEYRLDAYIVGNSDPHFSEYLPTEYKEIEWLTGFTGSNALVFVTHNDAFLWTDGRYFVQAEKQLAGSEFQMVKIATKDNPTLTEMIEKLLPEGRKIGINSLTTSQEFFENIKKTCDKKKIDIIEDYDLITEIWEDRPVEEKEFPFIHEIEFAGFTPKEKIENLREKLKEKDADVTVISTLEDIAWLFNIRGFDVLNNPVVTSYALIDQENAIFFIDSDRLSMELLEHFQENGVDYLGYDEIFAKVNNLNNKKIYLDKKNTGRSLFKLINESNEVINGINLTTELKAIKNDIEIKNQKNAYIKDGVALTKFIYWLKNNPDIEKETEYSVGEKLGLFRKAQKYYQMPSFDTIAAYKENAAMMHYRAEKDSKNLKNESFLLVDSGGQYLDGTTDITRTIALGKLSKEEIKDFTLVLKGHLNLLNTIFLEGTTGHALDAITRRPIWANRMDYKSGTGHGVGYFLGVHEGPQNISRVHRDAELEPGMIVTIEPGIYKAGKHGIRTENVVLVVEDEDTDDGQFYKFDVLSFAPVDRDAIDASLLTEEEKIVLNDYHNNVFKKLSRFLTREESQWLEEVTQPID
jgi:Xaa-Pro aminopeptidase